MMESWIKIKRQVNKTEEVKREERSQTGREGENQIVEGEELEKQDGQQAQNGRVRAKTRIFGETERDKRKQEEFRDQMTAPSFVLAPVHKYYHIVYRKSSG